MSVRVNFERIGRRHDVAPLDVDSIDPDSIAESVYRYARQFLASRDVEVSVDLERMRGQIFCGFHNGGSFSIERTAPWMVTETRYARDGQQIVRVIHHTRIGSAPMSQTDAQAFAAQETARHGNNDARRSFHAQPIAVKSTAGGA